MNEKDLTFKNIFIKGAVIFNPVLVQFAGLCPVVAASATLKSAVILSAVMFVDLTVVCVIASALLKKIPRWVRMPIYLLLGLAIICPLLYYIENATLTDLSLSMKIYIPLIAVNSITAVHCEQFAVKNSVKAAFYDAATVGLGAAAVFIVCGAVREILGSGSIAGIPVHIPVTFRGAALPFGCLILLGFLSALLRAFTRKYYPESFDTSGRKLKESKPAAPEKAAAPKPKPQPQPKSQPAKAEEPAQVDIIKTEEIADISFDDYEELLRSIEEELNEVKGDDGK